MWIEVVVYAMELAQNAILGSGIESLEDLAKLLRIGESGSLATMEVLNMRAQYFRYIVDMGFDHFRYIVEMGVDQAR